VTHGHYNSPDAAAIADLLAAVEELSRHLAIALTRVSPGFAAPPGHDPRSRMTSVELTPRAAIAAASRAAEV